MWRTAMVAAGTSVIADLADALKRSSQNEEPLDD
jgi:hypothetical protein